MPNHFMAFQLHGFQHDRPLFVDFINCSTVWNRECFFPARADLTDAGGKRYVGGFARDVLAGTAYSTAFNSR